MLLTTEEVATLFKVSKATVRRKAVEGKLPSVETCFGPRYRLSEITARPDDSDMEGNRAKVMSKLLNAKDALERVLEEL